jgi:hypothetical protein
MRKALFALAAVLVSPALQAQTIEDGVMMPENTLCAGFVYAHDRWDEYWEGTLQRDNGNIGDLTTQSVAFMGTYGVTDRLNVIAMLPYVSTGASQGVLHGMSGLQDLTIAAKYRVFQRPLSKALSLRAFAVGVAGTPATGYTADFLPLSIGMASSRLSGRMTATLQAKERWFLTGTAAYTWRGNVTLDRGAYFTDGQMFMTDEVEMPNVVDYSVSVGYTGNRLHIPLTYTQQTTRGGGDIRRQDMPFVSTA